MRGLIEWLKSLQDRVAIRRILVLGDSHADVFRYRQFRLSMPLTHFEVCSVGGATVSGLENPNSVTNALAVFREKLATTPSSTIVLLMLGEVDTGFVIWYRAKKHETTVEQALASAIANYRRLIEEVRGQHAVIVMSAPLPTITDDNDWGEVANLRREIQVPQADRLKLTLQFNQLCKEVCAGLDCPFVDLDAASLDENGDLRAELLNPDLTDHHYAPSAHARLIMGPLIEAIRRL